MRSKAEQKVGYHRAQAEKHDRAAAFFRENPAFDPWNKPRKKPTITELESLLKENGDRPIHVRPDGSISA